MARPEPWGLPHLRQYLCIDAFAAARHADEQDTSDDAASHNPPPPILLPLWHQTTSRAVLGGGDAAAVPADVEYQAANAGERADERITTGSVKRQRSGAPVIRAPAAAAAAGHDGCGGLDVSASQSGGVSVLAPRLLWTDAR